MSVARIFAHFGSTSLDLCCYVNRGLKAAVAFVLLVSLTSCGDFAFKVTSKTLSPTDIRDPVLQAAFRSPHAEYLTAGEIFTLLNGNTLVSRSIQSPDTLQYGYFGVSGDLFINSAPGRLTQSAWSVNKSQLCYAIGGETVCSHVRAAPILDRGLPAKIYFFTRVSDGSPTVLFVSIVHGYAIPEARL